MWFNFGAQFHVVSDEVCEYIFMSNVQLITVYYFHKVVHIKFEQKLSVFAFFLDVFKLLD